MLYENIEASCFSDESLPLASYGFRRASPSKILQVRSNSR